MSNAFMVAVYFILARYFNDPSGLKTCTVGFSAVIFALKVVLSYRTPNHPQRVSFLPFTVPSKYVYWVELLLIQLITPRASFVGHLCGILSGLLFISGRLDFIFNIVDNLITFEPGNGHNIVFDHPQHEGHNHGRRIINGVLENRR